MQLRYFFMKLTEEIYKNPDVNWDFRVTLVEPEIPPNTGNIGRVCLGTGASLHLVEPLGFDLGEKQLRRAGLDYWKHLKVNRYSNLDSFLNEADPSFEKVYLTTKAKKSVFDHQFSDKTYFLFGKETAGLPVSLLEKHPERCLKIPMFDDRVRSFNLANSVSVVVFEALRQQLARVF